MVAGNGWEAWGWEDNPDLRFPYSVRVFDRMCRTESQIGSIFRAVTLPIRGAAWTLNTDGVDPAIAAFVADEINLDGGVHRPGGLNHPEHLRQVLLALRWGFAPFETVYEIGPGRTPGAPSVVAHLKQLALRPPVTLTEVRATLDGDLDGIVQMPPGYDTPDATIGVGGPRSLSAVHGHSPQDVWIPAARLAFYCFEREGADWHGTSLLRASYKDWMLKEQNLLKASQAVERQSMGLPVVSYDDDDDRDMALEIASAARSGSTAGVAIPRQRMTMELLGVSGTVIDPVPLIKYHDQQMGKAALAMFLDLGHDAGARALGDTFADFFAMSLNSVADWIATTTTVEVIRRLVDVNFGPGQAIPVLECEEITPGHSATAEALGVLADAGLLTPDAGLEAQQRRAYGLPPRDVPDEGDAHAAPVAPVPGPGSGPVTPTVADSIATAAALVDRLAQLAAGQ